MKTSIARTIVAVTLAATATAGALQAAEERQAVQPAVPAYGTVGPYAPYGFHPFVPPYAYGYAPYAYGYGYGYHHAPWAWNPWAQERAMIEHAEAIQDWADQQMQAELEWMEQQRLARQAPMEQHRRWREAESDAWHRWVDPYGAWLDDMSALRDAQRDAWAEARRQRYDRVRPHRRLPLAAGETGQLAQEQAATEPKGDTAK